MSSATWLKIAAFVASVLFAPSGGRYEYHMPCSVHRPHYYSQTILRCSLFWTSIGPEYPPSPELTALKLQRSGNASLKIECFDPGESHLNQLLPHLYRAEYMYIRTEVNNLVRILTSEMPRLRILKLLTSQSSSSTAPALILGPPSHIGRLNSIKLKGIVFSDGLSG